MTAKRLITRLPLLAMLLLGAACGESTDETPEAAIALTLTAAGGTFTGTGALAGVVLVVPADAVTESTAAWMAPPAAARPLPETGALVGPEVEFGPAALTLARPARLELPFDPSAVTAQGQDIDHVKVWRVGPDGWQIATPAEPPRADEAVGRVVLETTTLTRFGAGIERP